MTDATAPSVVDAPEWLLQHVTEPLHRVGIDLPPFGLQAVLLLGVLVALFAFRGKLWPPAKAKPISLLTGATVMLIGLIVLADWTMQFLYPLPGYLSGTVRTERLFGISIALLDLRGEQVNDDSGAIDSESGEFVLRYRIGLGTAPKALAVRRAGCRDELILLGRRQLRSGTLKEVAFQCSPPA
jgi:hypothetical protein